MPANRDASVEAAGLEYPHVTDGGFTYPPAAITEAKRRGFVRGAEWQREQTDAELASLRELLQEIDSHWRRKDYDGAARHHGAQVTSILEGEDQERRGE